MKGREEDRVSPSQTQRQAAAVVVVVMVVEDGEDGEDNNNNMGGPHHTLERLWISALVRRPCRSRWRQSIVL